MELVIKIAAIGIIVAVLQQILTRSGRDEYAMLVVLAGLLAVVAMLIPELKDLYSSATSVMGFCCCRQAAKTRACNNCPACRHSCPCDFID